MVLENMQTRPDDRGIRHASIEGNRWGRKRFKEIWFHKEFLGEWIDLAKKGKYCRSNIQKS